MIEVSVDLFSHSHNERISATPLNDYQIVIFGGQNVETQASIYNVSQGDIERR